MIVLQLFIRKRDCSLTITDGLLVSAQTVEFRIAYETNHNSHETIFCVRSLHVEIRFWTEDGSLTITVHIQTNKANVPRTEVQLKLGFAEEI